MSTTTKILVGAALAIAGVVAYRRYKAKGELAQLATAPTPVELPSGGTVYGTTATTDLRKAQLLRTFVPATEVYRTPSQDAMLGIF